MFGRINRKLKESKSRLKSKAAAENINKWKQPISESDSDGMKAMKETYKKSLNSKYSPDDLLKKDIAKMAPKAEKKVAAKGSSLAAGAFSQLERDLPKGGAKGAMKVAAEQVPSSAEKALVGGMKKKAIGKTLGKAAIGGALGLGAGVAIDYALDSEDAGDARVDKDMTDRAKYGDVAKNLPKNLPAKLKGSPKMIDMESPSVLPQPKGKSPKDVARGFLQETKRQFPDYEESVDVEVRNPRGETTERYGAKLKSNKPLNSVSRRKAVGIHQVLKDEPGMKSPKKGVIEFDDEE